ncbi:MAG: hypothetical protein AABY22_10150 [Nanoarchaeota archaeon]
MAFNTNGDPSAYIKYVDKKVVIGAGDADKVTVTQTSVDLASDVSMTNNDINARGGYAQSFVYVCNNVLQNTFRSMTSSIAYVSNSLPDTKYDIIPLVRSGSVLGIALSVQNTTQTVKSGALSASVMLDNANVSLTLGMNTGSVATATTTKDTVTFNPGQRLGVSLSASSAYLCEPNATSASFICTVLVEM